MRNINLCILLVLLISIPSELLSMEKTHHYITSANGYSAIVYDEIQRRINMFFPHIYKNYDYEREVRNIAYDTYFGILIGSKGFWLSERDEPFLELGYIPRSGIIHTKRILEGLEVDEYFFAPMTLNASGMIMLIKIRALSDVNTLSIFSLHNFHMGLTETGTDFKSEHIIYDSSDIFFETSSTSRYTVAYKPLTENSIHSTNPTNPYSILKSGNHLSNIDDSGEVDDAVCGFEKDFSNLKSGDERWFGVLITYRDDKDFESIISTVKDFIKNSDPEELLNAEILFWEKHLDSLDQKFIDMSKDDALLNSAAVLLKMAQVREDNTDTRRPYGQILASLPPGMWNITWLRDMMYSIYALIDIGSQKDALDAMKFILNADTGYFKEYVGLDYKFSVCRYFGDGREESDTNEDGPNIEFDGPGLFLIGVAKYIERYGRDDLYQFRDVIYSGFADVLIGLIDNEGLIRKDSSIWERHLNGKEKHFTYTQITALSGLCAASYIAERFGDTEKSLHYRTAYQNLRKNISEKLIHQDDYLVSSLEEFQSYAGYLDASVVEAINFGIFGPDSTISKSTLNILKNLKTAGGGYKRNDDGDWYDRQEWLFIDLRIADAYKRAGDSIQSQNLIDRAKEYTTTNNSQFPELITEDGKSVTGAIPMIGFGAASYILANIDTGFIGCNSEPADASTDYTDIIEEDYTDNPTIEGNESMGLDTGIHFDIPIPDNNDSDVQKESGLGCGCNLID